MYGTVRVNLQGDRNVDHKKLIQIGIACAEAKLLSKGANTIIQEVSVTDMTGTDENGVSIVVRGRRVPRDGQSALGMPLALVGKPIEAADLTPIVANYNRNFSRGANPTDVVEAVGTLFHWSGRGRHTLQSACTNDHETFKTSNGSTGPSPSQNQSTSISGSVSSVSIQDDGTTSYVNKRGIEFGLHFLSDGNFVRVIRGASTMPHCGRVTRR